ncbi:hypothetical protein IG631_14608 [Alternaria alternata]|jgi:hypothetical protein|nr:hypothetical protein IG631_14608 [Alternaria alternata]
MSSLTCVVTVAVCGTYGKSKSQNTRTRKRRLLHLRGNVPLDLGYALGIHLVQERSAVSIV